MKRILVIIAAMAAVLSSCRKEIEQIQVEDRNDIVLNISVSNLATETRALIKSGWEADDRISIWYDTDTDETPDLVIKYDGSDWVQDNAATISGNRPSEGSGKYIKALYNNTVMVASEDDYTYENKILTFSIENWRFLTEIQVVVKGLDSEKAGNYTISCDKFTPVSGAGYAVGAETITAVTGTEGDAAVGIANADGVAFVFATADYSETKQDFTFTLTDNNVTPPVTQKYKPYVTIQSVGANKSIIKALIIASSKFNHLMMKLGTGDPASPGVAE